MENLGYNKALEKVFEVRKQRQKVYGDFWKTDEDWMILAQIKQKVNRLETFIIRTKDINDYESKIDTLIDLINYSLFLLENEIEKKEVKT